MKTIITTATLAASFALTATAYGITFSINDGEIITTPVVISGNTEQSELWAAFEGQVGTMTVLDSNDTVLAEAPMQVDGEVVVGAPAEFFATADFETVDTAGVIRFNNYPIADTDTATSVEFAVLFEEPIDAIEPDFPIDNPLGEIAESGLEEKVMEKEMSWWQNLLEWIMFWK